MFTDIDEAMFEECDPMHLGRAICLVHWSREVRGQKPGTDARLHSDDTYRGELIRDIQSVWSQLSGYSHDEGQFPYREGWVFAKWIKFRKDKSQLRAAWVAKYTDGNEGVVIGDMTVAEIRSQFCEFA